MTSQEEDVEVLTQLGLTVLQSEVYLTLIKLGRASIKTIATTAKLDRANVYRVMPKLEEYCLVEKTITVPIFFKAIPIRDGFTMLLAHKAKEFQEIEAKSREIIKKYKENKEQEIQVDYQFELIPAYIATTRKLREMVERSQKGYDFIFYSKSLAKVIDNIIVIFKELIKKGVKIRLIACMHEEETLHKRILNLKKKGLFEIRYMFSEPQITLTLFDKKEALINTAPFPMGTPSLWSNNPVIVSIFQDYFDRKWRESKKYF